MDHELEAEVVPKVIKHSLWFQDGNIILQTTSPSEDEIHLFRCHKSVLCKHSTVFSRMFGEDNYVCVRRSEEYEGVPVISMPDSSSDVDALLNMLYDPLKLPYKKHHPETLSAIQGPLKLATKYKMDSLRGRFITMLEVDWPSELSKYDKKRADMNNPSWYQSLDQTWPHFRSDPARVICLAKDCDVTSVLPVAYYELGTAYNPINPDPEYGVFDRPIAKHVLTAEDWEVLMRGRGSIQHRLSRFFKDVLSARPPLRPDGRSFCHRTANKDNGPEAWGCGDAARDWWFDYSYEALIDVNTFRDPLAFLKSLPGQIAGLELCPNCKIWMQQLMLSERQNIWDRLGEFYGIEDDEPGCSATTQA